MISLQHRRTGTAPVVAIISRKGGPGKTTVAAHLMNGLALRGYATLGLEVEDRLRLHAWLTGHSRQRGDAPIDDSQTTYGLLTHPEHGIGRAAYQIDTPKLLQRVNNLSKEQVQRLAIERGWQPQPFDFVPGSERLRVLESRIMMEMQSTVRRDFDPYEQLSIALGPVRERYDVVIMDTPPSLATIQSNILMAATHVIFVVDFDADSIEDYLDTQEFFKNVRSQARQLGRPLPLVLGVAYNKFDASFLENDVRLWQAYTETHLDPERGEMVPPMVEYMALARIPWDRQRIVGAMNQRVTVHTYAPTTPVGVAMYELCRSVEAGLGWG